MPGIMADHDVEGDFDIVLRTLMSAEWRDLWNELDYDVESFMSLGTWTCGNCARNEKSF